MSRQGHDSLQQISKVRDECFSLISNYAFTRRASNPLLSYLLKFWCGLQGSNLGQRDYQSRPLPTEVSPHIKVRYWRKLSSISSPQLQDTARYRMSALYWNQYLLNSYLLAKPEPHYSRVITISCHSGCYPNRLPLAHTIVLPCAVMDPRLHPSSTEKVAIFKFHSALQNQHCRSYGGELRCRSPYGYQPYQPFSRRCCEPSQLTLHKSQIVGLNYLSITGDSTSLSIFDCLKHRFSYCAQSHMAP